MIPDDENLKKEMVHISHFMRIGKAISSAVTIRETLDVVMTQIGEIFNPTNWSLLLKDFDTGDLKFVIAVGNEGKLLHEKILPKGEGIAGWIAETGETVIVENISKDKRFQAEYDKLIDFKTKSVIGVPLKTDNEIFGVIELLNELEEKAFSALDLHLLTAIADFAAIAIEKAYYYKALHKLASLDSLTGLYNRRTFKRFIQKEIERSKRGNTTFSLLMIDVDDFKQVNDNYGHIEGDKVLIRIAELLTGIIRKADNLCRFGGDEFIVLMPDSKLINAENLKTRIFNSLDADNKANKIKIFVSIGVNQASGEDISEIISLVDKDMYRQKQNHEERSIHNVARNLENMIAEENNT